MNKAPLQLTIGSQYVTREGIVTTTLRKSQNGTNYGFEGFVRETGQEKDYLISWNSGGNFLSPDCEHRFDLIAEFGK